jgi:hypothetical protein
MKLSIVLALILTGFLSPRTLQAQAPPDYSGTWVLDLVASKFPSSPKPVLQIRMVVKQTGRTIDVTETSRFPEFEEVIKDPTQKPKAIKAPAKDEVIQFTVSIDGDVVKQVDGHGHPLEIKAFMERGVLKLVTSAILSDKISYQQTSTWELIDGGKGLLLSQSVDGSAQPTVWRLKKAE